MSDKKTIIVGNWKMNLNASQASLLVQRLHEHIPAHKDLEVVIAPPYLFLQPLNVQIDHRKFKMSAQDAYFKDDGAYTGQISFTMLRGLTSYCIIGHSERRHVFNESLDDTAKKMAASYRNGITPILCVGETKYEKLAGETNQVIHDQIISALANVTSEEIEKLVVAYEPVWAIGSGDNADPKDVAKVVKVIKNNIKQLYGQVASDNVRVLYGGSVKPDTASGYLRLNEIDGLLVGGASLNYRSFSEIVNDAYSIKRSLHTSKDH